MPDNDGVLLEYYSAAWCLPCKGMGPVIEELRAAGWRVTKIDVDQDQAKAAANSVQAIPTFIVYKNNRAVRRLVGARPKFALETELRLARDGD